MVHQPDIFKYWIYLPWLWRSLTAITSWLCQCPFWLCANASLSLLVRSSSLYTTAEAKAKTKGALLQMLWGTELKPHRNLQRWWKQVYGMHLAVSFANVEKKKGIWWGEIWLSYFWQITLQGISSELCPGPPLTVVFHCQSEPVCLEGTLSTSWARKL